MSRRWSRTIYVGNLPGDIREREVEDLFYKVGDLFFSLFCVDSVSRNCQAIFYATCYSVYA